MRFAFPLALLLALAPLTGQTQKTTKDLDIAADRVWTDTGIDCQPGDTVRITATGTLQYFGSNENGPEGLPRGFRDLLRIMPYNDAGRGALLVRMGDSDAARPLLVGPRRELKV